MNSIFTLIKSQITTRQAAEVYGIPVNRSGMACCPFHDDHHPSMKVDERFYCFGCHETGDVIDFTAKLFSLSLYDAAKKLADDFNLRPLPPGQSIPIPKTSNMQSERKEEQRALKLLIDYEKLLKNWQEKYAPLTPDSDIWDDRFVYAVQHLTSVSDTIDSLLSADPEERKETMQFLQDENILQGITETLHQSNEEVRWSAAENDRAA